MVGCSRLAPWAVVGTLVAWCQGCAVPLDSPNAGPGDTGQQASDAPAPALDADDAGADTSADAAALPPPEPCLYDDECQKNSPTTPYCRYGTGVCVQCLAHVHCGDGQQCNDAFTCAPIQCQPNATVCDDDRLATCSPQGNNWLLTDCPAQAPLCIAGKCRACQPGKQFCAAVTKEQNAKGIKMSKALMLCDPDGQGATVAEACEGDAFCLGGPYGKCVACLPGDVTCQGDAAVVCADDGLAWQLKYDCAKADESCIGGFCHNPCDLDLKTNEQSACSTVALDFDPTPNDCALGTSGCTAAAPNWTVTLANQTGSTASVKLVGPGGKQASYQIAPHGTSTLTLPPVDWKLADQTQGSAGLNDRSIRLQTKTWVTATQHQPGGGASSFAGAALGLLPESFTGTHYVLIGWPRSLVTASPAITIVGMWESKSQVAVTSVTPLVGPAGKVTLAKGEVLHLPTSAPDADVTGGRVDASQAVAVFYSVAAAVVPLPESCSEGKCANAGWPCTTRLDCPVVGGGDPLVAQLLPEPRWAKVYVAAKFTPRGKAKDIWRAVAGNVQVTLTTEPAQGPTVTLKPYQWHDFESDQDFVVTGTAPFELAQFMVGRLAPDASPDTCTAQYLGQKACAFALTAKNTPIACAKDQDCPYLEQPGDALVGDPDMVVTMPQTLWPKKVRLVSPPQYAQHYLTLVRQGATAVQLDGKVLPDAQFKPIAKDYAVARVAVAAGVHLVAAKAPVQVVAHGWSEHKSYAFSAVGGRSVMRAVPLIAHHTSTLALVTAAAVLACARAEPSRSASHGATANEPDAGDSGGPDAEPAVTDGEPAKPPTTKLPISCLGKCGQSFGSNQCSCSKTCLAVGNCCANYLQVCGGPCDGTVCKSLHSTCTPAHCDPDNGYCVVEMADNGTSCPFAECPGCQPCWDGRCNLGACMPPGGAPKAAGSRCPKGASKTFEGKCDGQGACVDCLAEADCPMPATCHVNPCTNGTCAAPQPTGGAPCPVLQLCKLGICSPDGQCEAVPAGEGSACFGGTCKGGKCIVVSKPLPPIPPNWIGQPPSICSPACATAPNSMTRCVQGLCLVARCQTGFRDDDGQGENGCEVVAPPACEITVHAGPAVAGADGSEGKPFSSIAVALSLAEPGCVVSLQPGKYAEGVHWSGALKLDKPGIVLRGLASAPEEVVLSGKNGDAPAQDALITVTAKDVVVEGLELQHLCRSVFGATSAGNLTVRYCRAASVGNGAGLWTCSAVTALDLRSEAGSRAQLNDIGPIKRSEFPWNALTGGNAPPPTGAAGVTLTQGAGLMVRGNSIHDVQGLNAIAQTGGIAYIVAGGDAIGIAVGATAKNPTIHANAIASLKPGLPKYDGVVQFAGGSAAGIGLAGPITATISASNTVDGQPVQYLFGASASTWSGLSSKNSGTSLASTVLAQSKGVTIKQAAVGSVLMANCPGCRIEKSSVGGSLRVVDSPGAQVVDNEVAGPIDVYNSPGAAISNNYIHDFQGAAATAYAGQQCWGCVTVNETAPTIGIHIAQSSGVSVTGNKIANLAGGSGGCANGEASGTYWCQPGGAVAAIRISYAKSALIQGNSVDLIQGGAAVSNPVNVETAGQATGIALVQCTAVTLMNNIVQNIAGGDGKPSEPAFDNWGQPKQNWLKGAIGGSSSVISVDNVAKLTIDGLAASQIGSPKSAKNATALLSLEAVTSVQARRVTLLGSENCKCLISLGSAVPEVVLSSSILESIDCSSGLPANAAHSTLTCQAGESPCAKLAGPNCTSNKPILWGSYQLACDATQCSAGIDDADPADDYCKEPAPNGCRADQGFYGGTMNSTPKPGAKHCACNGG